MQILPPSKKATMPHYAHPAVINKEAVTIDREQEENISESDIILCLMVAAGAQVNSKCAW